GSNFRLNTNTAMNAASKKTAATSGRTLTGRNCANQRTKAKVAICATNASSFSRVLDVFGAELRLLLHCSCKIESGGQSLFRERLHGRWFKLIVSQLWPNSLCPPVWHRKTNQLPSVHASYAQTPV